MQWDTGTVDVPSAGTAVQVLDDPRVVRWIQFTARQGNSGGVYVGRSDVSSTNGRELRPPETSNGYDHLAQTEYDFGKYGSKFDNLPGGFPMNIFYVDAYTNGNDVDWEAIFE